MLYFVLSILQCGRRAMPNSLGKNINQSINQSINQAALKILSKCKAIHCPTLFRDSAKNLCMLKNYRLKSSVSKWIDLRTVLS